jgi:hypothetical protein
VSETELTIHGLAGSVVYGLAKLYGPGGHYGPGGPPQSLVDSLERLETAAVDPGRLADGVSVAAADAQTLADVANLNSLAAQAIGILSGLYDEAGAEVLDFFIDPSFPAAITAVESDAKGFTPGAAPPITLIQPPPPSGPAQLAVSDFTTGVNDWENATAYAGPVGGLTSEYINPSPDNLRIISTQAGVFVHAGPGENVLDASQADGFEVLDGGGSSILLGGYGPQAFFIDGNTAPADIWTTIANFTVDDSVTAWGISQSGFSLDWEDGQGAPGHTGLTLHAASAGKPNVSVTLVGFSKADLKDGTLAYSFGVSASGISYLSIHGGG